MSEKLYALTVLSSGVRLTSPNKRDTNIRLATLEQSLSTATIQLMPSNIYNVAPQMRCSLFRESMN